MGYTHYWRAGESPAQFVEAFPQIQLDAVKIVKAAEARGIKLGDAIGEGRPTITEGALALNGASPDDYETFALQPVLHGFDFCKTARKPYDLVVTAILIRAAHHAPRGIAVESDGYWEDDWKPARELVQELFGETPEPIWRD